MGGVPVSDDMVLITEEEYGKLKGAYEWLGCLEAAGVDNWSGYEYAIQLRDESEEED